jgi:CHAT domain-containing protein/predicted negative regulator of RcsB-dependent stress response
LTVETLTSEAEQLRAKWQGEASELALKKYQIARQLLHARGDRQGEARLLKEEGDTSVTLGRYQSALGLYGRSLQLYQFAGDRVGEGDVLNSIGGVYVLLGKYPIAMRYSERALNVVKTLNDGHDALSRIYNNLAQVHYFLADFPKSSEFTNKVLALWSLDDGPGEQAKALMTSAWISLDQGHKDETITILSRAISLCRRSGDRRQEASVLSVMGSQYAYIGDYQHGLDLQLEALKTFREVGDPNGQAEAHSKIAFTFLSLGDLDQSLSHNNQAADLYHELGNRYFEGTMFANIGDVYAARRDTGRALQEYASALPLVSAAGDKQWEAFILNSIGAVYAARQEIDKGLGAYNRALKLFHTLGNQRWEGNTLNGIGSIYLASGTAATAIDFFNRALRLSRVVGDLSEESRALCNLARAESKRGNLEKAILEIETVLKINETLRTKLMSQQSRATYLASIHQSYELYVDLLMQKHASDPARNFAARALEAAERGRARSLVEMMIEARANIRKGANPELLFREQVLEEQLDRQLQEQIILLASTDKKQWARAKAMDNDIEAISAQYQQVQAQIRGASTQYSSLSQPAPITNQEIKQLLDPDTVLLEYSLGDERSFVWVVDHDSVHGFVLPARERIENLARRLHAALAAGGLDSALRKRPTPGVSLTDDPKELADSLGSILLDQVVSLLHEKRLVVIADGALQYIPFSVLTHPNPGRRSTANANTSRLAAERVPLILNYEVVYLPSASVLNVQRHQFAGRPPAPLTVAVFADPVFDSSDPRFHSSNSVSTDPPTEKLNFRSHLSAKRPTQSSPLDRAIRDVGFDRKGLGIPRLPFSLKEANAITSVSSPGTAMEALGFTASRQTLRATDLSKYRMIHFATHGILNSQHPELSGILLSMIDEEGRPSDGFLQLHEIYDLKLSADLVVLSACQTALGKDFRGEGLVGLTRGFMYAGARRVVSSLWKVDDAATAQLMAYFYREMLKNGQNPATALRAAQSALATEKRWHSPYYWAGFILQGEWN